eukprot:GHVP01021167.1.p1 GENE.GHVP01021167.1~~GHVP01021167.1.p1  ORF type:complete len:196 (+),score=20.31 GHVP01021167.1:39-590(+)
MQNSSSLFGVTIRKWDTITVLFLSLVGAILSEGLVWFILYRKDDYKNLVQEIKTLSAKYEAMLNGSSTQKPEARQQLKTTIEQKFKSLTMMKTKGGFIVTVLQMSLIPLAKNYYDAIPVAKFPFHVPGFFQKISHNSLPGEDYTDCSMWFLQILASTVYRACLQEAIGHGVTALGWGQTSNGV